jgi:L-fuculose-phosphate aldolase
MAATLTWGPPQNSGHRPQVTGRVAGRHDAGGTVAAMSTRVSGELRAAVIGCARRMLTGGLVTGAAGNVSARAGDEIVITPSGRRYDTLRPEELCVVDLAGRPVDLPLRPSSELPMHLAAYRLTGAGAVVHTHSTFATAVATTCPQLPAIHYAIGFLGGPLRVAPYATFGTAELADGMRTALDGRHAALLQNHGVIAVGADTDQAYDRARLTEWLAELYYRATRLGTPRLLTEAELDAFAGQVSALSYGANDGPPARESEQEDGQRDGHEG